MANGGMEAGVLQYCTRPLTKGTSYAAVCGALRVLSDRNDAVRLNAMLRDGSND